MSILTESVTPAGVVELEGADGVGGAAQLALVASAGDWRRVAGGRYPDASVAVTAHTRVAVLHPRVPHVQIPAPRDTVLQHTKPYNWVFHDKKNLQIFKILQITKTMSFFYMIGNFQLKVVVCISHDSNTNVW